MFVYSECEVYINCLDGVSNLYVMVSILENPFFGDRPEFAR